MKKMNAILAGAAACVAMGGAYAAEPAAEAVDFAKYAENIVRVSRITVDPARVEEYKIFAAEVGRESMKKEPGVRVLYSVQEKKDPTQFTILEIYASDAAYKHHIETPHFKKYKTGTLEMVKKLELIDCNPLVPEALIKP